MVKPKIVTPTVDYDPSQIATKEEEVTARPAVDYDPSQIAPKGDITAGSVQSIGAPSRPALTRDHQTVADIAHWLNLEIALENRQGNAERATTIANIRSVMIDHGLMVKRAQLVEASLGSR
jgi:hypothetical protein